MFDKFKTINTIKLFFIPGKSALTFYEALAIEEEAEALKRYRDLLDNILRPLR